MNPVITRMLTPQDGSTSVIAQIRLFILMFLPLLMPLLAYAFTGIGETLTRSIFGSGAVIAFGKRVFLFLAIRHPPTGQQGNRDCHFRRGLFDPDEHHGDFSDLACRTGARGW